MTPEILPVRIFSHYHLPGGYVVFLATTSNGNPPGVTGGMTTAGSALWCRLAREGFDTGWHRVEGTQSWVRASEWWALVESEGDVREAWEGCVGGVWPPPRYDETYFRGVAALDALAREAGR